MLFTFPTIADLPEGACLATWNRCVSSLVDAICNGAHEDQR